MSNLGTFSMWELFRGEVETQMRAFTEGLLAIEGGGSAKEHFAATMRAAHSIKGAARIVHLDLAVSLAHSMEDCLVGAQEGVVTLDSEAIDVLLRSGDLLAELSKIEESAVPAWVGKQSSTVDALLVQLAEVRTGKPVTAAQPAPPPQASDVLAAALAAPAAPEDSEPTASGTAAATDAPTSIEAGPLSHGRAPADRSIKVAAQTLNRLMGLAGESVVQSRWFEPFSKSLLKLKRKHNEIDNLLESLQTFAAISPEAGTTLAAARQKVQETRDWAAERQGELDAFGLRSAALSDQLYREVVRSRMRPFGDGIGDFPRLVRDVSRQLGKQVRLEITGTNTEIDREILDRLEGPLNHAILNSLDHGIERPDERLAAGKPPTGTIRIDARHHAGLFVLTISDDGSGVNIESLRVAVVDRGMATREMAESFSEAELLQFLFLPGFSTARTVTDISGRGVGLDAVQDMAKSVDGVASIVSRAGQGVTIQLELPLTLSVIRMIVAEIGGEPFAFPMTRIAGVLRVNRADLSSLQCHQYISLDGEQIGVISAFDALEMPGLSNWGEQIPMVLLADGSTRYGLAVDRFVGEYDLVVRPLDPRFGKVPTVLAAALLDDGAPVLIIDVEDLTRSVEVLLHGGRLRGLRTNAAAPVTRKRILVVDDSVTVRELQRSLLQNRGYAVEVAVDGMDGWNALRAAPYHLTITDVDMPRMDGLELVSQMKADPKLQAMPVIIVSYKDRDEDRMRGLEAGADRYLTKSSFHDESLLSAVAELIGPPES